MSPGCQLRYLGLTSMHTCSMWLIHAQSTVPTDCVLHSLSGTPHSDISNSCSYGPELCYSVLGTMWCYSSSRCQLDNKDELEATQTLGPGCDGRSVFLACPLA